jgi:hypothetical protein
MILIALTAALLFWGRDYLVLRIGPPTKVPQRVWVYSATVFLMGLMLAILTWSFGPQQVLGLIHSPQVFASLIAFHLGAGLLCFWLKHTERYQDAWLAAMIPAPGVWFLLTESTLLPAYGMGSLGTSLVVGLLSALWIAMMIVTVLQMRQHPMPVEEMDFAVGLAGWSNCLAIGLISVTI